MTANTRLELEQDQTFQRREWRLQRLGWIAWGVVTLAGLAGLLGPGPLSDSEAVTSDGALIVAYDRFLHYHHPSQLKLTLRPRSSGEEVRVQLSQSLLDRIEIHRIEPEPARRELTPDGIVYVFSLADELDAATIVFHVEYESMGSGRGTIRLAGGEPVKLKQFVYP
jgi:hypothetical protein